MKKSIKSMFAILIAVAMVLPLASMVFAAPPPAPGLLDPKAIPKFVNELTGPPPVYDYVTQLNPNTGQYERYYTVDVTEFYQQILPPPLPMTKVWGYGGQAHDALTGASLGYVRNAPGPSFEALRGEPINVKYINSLTGEYMFPVDPTLHWADPNMMGMPMAPFLPFPPGYADAQSPVAIIPHLHGGEVQSSSDGNPEAWFTWDGIHGMAYSTEEPTEANSAVFRYPNEQPATMLWYHDHALGVTRLNVMSGLAGFYPLRDPSNGIDTLLPSGKYEMPLVIQDRIFNADGSFWFPTVGLDPNAHPYWQPEFFGDTIMVNGEVWPFMKVDQGQYRLRLLDGSNARFYTLEFKAPALNLKLPFTIIGTDGGYLQSPVTVKSLTIAPGERYDVLIDFSGLPAGTKVIMTNTAKTPFPAGASPDPKTTGQIMQFVVQGSPGPAPAVLPPLLNPTLAGLFPTIQGPSVTRTLTLQEIMGPLGPTEILLDGQKWMSPISELPMKGATEQWVIVNPTMDTHPIHLHLTQFQLVSRQTFDMKAYQTAWLAANGVMGNMLMHHLDQPTVPVLVGPYLKNKAVMANPWEMGWKDTIQSNPGEVLILNVRFAPIDGTPEYPFNPTSGPGYVWHCHILDHEDNEMMRPMKVVETPMVMGIPERTVTIGSKQIIPVMATNPNGGMMTFALVNAPVDATITSDGIIYWIPKIAGTYDFSVVVSDNIVPSVTRSVRINVIPDPAPAPPIIEPVPLGLVLNNVLINHQVKLYDPNGDPMTCNLVGGPAGASVDSTGMITWTPGTAGTYSFSIEASDGTLSTSRQIITTVVDGYDAITRWNMEVVNYLNTKKINPLFATRTTTMVHTAMFDAVNSIVGGYNEYLTKVVVSPTASIDAAAAAAAHQVMIRLYPADAPLFDQIYAEQIAGIPNDQNRVDGIAAGITCGDAIFNLRMTDWAAQSNVPYTGGTMPGEYRRTGMMAPMLPGWGQTTPWALATSSQFRLNGPPALDSVAYAEAYNQVKMLGARASTVRTVEQSEDALFWIPPVPDHYYALARELSARYDLSLPEKARVFALLTMGVADSVISQWETKYHYAFWRPITAIQNGEYDGNPSTIEMNNWMPLIMTPAFPEYASVHSTVSSTGAKLLALFFGTDTVTFVRTSLTPGLPAHEYNSISEMVMEAGASRIPAGVHFSFSDIEAQAAGILIAEYIWANELLLIP